jgi:hypothetical protein
MKVNISLSVELDEVPLKVSANWQKTMMPSRVAQS